MTSVAIVGAGMSGLCMAIKLRQAGFEDFTIFEKASDVGGTWRENRYPGLTCDVPARYYSYSFAPNPDWSRVMAPGPEIWRYFQGIADRYGLRERIRFGSEVSGAEWVDGRWRLSTGETFDVLVSATGVLHHPRLPEIDGLETFAGPAFHSAQWDASARLEGARVGVIGTGSTGIQITCALAGVAAHLSLFQRTAQWVLPYPNREYARATRRLYRRWPWLNRAVHRFYQTTFEHFLGRAATQPGWQRTLIDRICRRNLRSVKDPELRRWLTPDYEPMCKRLVLSGDFYEAVQRPDVSVVADAIERIEPGGVRTRDGVLHELDVLVLATGFHAHAYMRPMELAADGVRLDDVWSPEPTAYRTVALPGFPNFFMLMGPHSPFGNQSLITIAETQADYVLAWLRKLRDGELAAAAPTLEATRRFNEQLRAAMPGTIWVTGCQSWYIGADGVPMNWPWTPERHREMLATPELEDFEVSR